MITPDHFLHLSAQAQSALFANATDNCDVGWVLIISYNWNLKLGVYTCFVINNTYILISNYKANDFKLWREWFKLQRKWMLQTLKGKNASNSIGNECFKLYREWLLQTLKRMNALNSKRNDCFKLNFFFSLNVDLISFLLPSGTSPPSNVSSSSEQKPPVAPSPGLDSPSLMRLNLQQVTLAQQQSQAALVQQAQQQVQRAQQSNQQQACA